MIAWVSGVVRVMPQSICRVSILSVRNENGTGSSSGRWRSSDAQSMVVPSRRAGVPVFRRPRERPRRASARQAQRGILAHPTGRDLPVAEVDQAAEEGARRQHHGAAGDLPAIGEDDRRHRAGIIQRQVEDVALDHGEAVGLADQALHGGAVELAVGLGAGAPDGRALAAVEHAELDAAAIGGKAHQPAESVDLPHQMPLADAADRRIAAHRADRIEAVGDEDRGSSGARRGARRLASGMAAADHDDVAGGRPVGSAGRWKESLMSVGHGSGSIRNFKGLRGASGRAGKATCTARHQPKRRGPPSTLVLCYRRKH